MNVCLTSNFNRPYLFLILLGMSILRCSIYAKFHSFTTLHRRDLEVEGTCESKSSSINIFLQGINVYFTPPTVPAVDSRWKEPRFHRGHDLLHLQEELCGAEKGGRLLRGRSGQLPADLQQQRWGETLQEISSGEVIRTVITILMSKYRKD